MITGVTSPIIGPFMTVEDDHLSMKLTDYWYYAYVAWMKHGLHNKIAYLFFLGKVR